MKNVLRLLRYGFPYSLEWLPGVVLLPHLGYVSETAMRVMYGQVVEDIVAWRSGEPIRRIDG